LEIKVFPKRFNFFLLVSILLSACAGLQSPGSDGTLGPDSPVVSTPGPAGEEPSPAPWEPAPGDVNMVRGEVFIEEQDILTLESFPPQFVLRLSGSLPTPCHQLRVAASAPDEQDRIQVEVYSLAKPDEVCIQVLEPFEANVPLGSYASGTYTVWVNGEQVGEIQP
jgi:hypothetical protein